jgi:exodeoxyribonuclease VII large subunit
MPNNAKHNPSLLVATPAALENGRHVYTVSELTRGIKLILETSFPAVWVEGEVSNFKAHTSGHLYFSLKDTDATLAAAIFMPGSRQVKFKIEDGLKVVCYGRVNAYLPRSQYQIIVERIEPKGIGSLQLALEQLKEKLAKEGLFASAHKRPIPYLPRRVGIVTSLSGAAICDILKVLDRRFGELNIVINPVQVQGDAAKDEIARAIADFNIFNETLPARERIEVMVVGRGGGSMEDLWAFNEEIVARAIYNSKIPVISAVGHEKDWTIADMVADVRAATPSVAAELITPKREDLKERVRGLTADLERSFLNTLSLCRDSIADILRRMQLGMDNALRLNTNACLAAQKKLLLLNPAVTLGQYQRQVSDFARQILVRMEHVLKMRQALFFAAADKLRSLSPLSILGRGYSITFRMPESKIIKSSADLNVGDTIKTRLNEGEVLSRVTEL